MLEIDSSLKTGGRFKDLLAYFSYVKFDLSKSLKISIKYIDTCMFYHSSFRKIVKKNEKAATFWKMFFVIFALGEFKQSRIRIVLSSINY